MKSKPVHRRVRDKHRSQLLKGKHSSLRYQVSGIMWDLLGDRLLAEEPELKVEESVAKRIEE